MSKLKPILLSTPMVQAILEGNKTVTRRIIKTDGSPIKAKYEIGDVLWVRETFIDESDFGESPNYVYKADCPNYQMVSGAKWKPSIFMPREVCRLFLKITNIRVERLQEITEDDAEKEGIKEFTKDGVLCKYGLDRWQWADMPKTPKEAFKVLLESINGINNWESNPFVWVIEFERTDKIID